jgi:hypothetical protein
MSKCLQKKFFFLQLEIYILKIHLSKLDLVCMIPTGANQTTLLNPKYILQKRKLQIQWF